jgi:hypothetical protein
MGKKHKPVWLNRFVAAPGPFLTLCLDEQTYLAAMKHCKILTPNPWLNAGANATLHPLLRNNREHTCVVCLEVGAHSEVETIGLLVHEAVHVWQSYAERIGEDKPAVEQEAYAIQAIAQELVSSYFDQTKGKKRGKNT